jgi:hypothetical protein
VAAAVVAVVAGVQVIVVVVQNGVAMVKVITARTKVVLVGHMVETQVVRVELGEMVGQPSLLKAV